MKIWRAWVIAALFLAGASQSPLAAAATPAPEYEVVDGAIVVFGHRLVPTEPLPEAGECGDCGPIHSVGFRHSPDGRWILIVSDVPLTSNDVWLYDTLTEAMPLHVVDRRRGQHLLGAEWHSGRVFEVSWGGMGYTASLMLDAENPGDPRKLNGLLLYDAGRDVYVRYLYDDATSADSIEIGSVLSAAGEPERFPISLDNVYLSDSQFMIEVVEIDGTSLIVTYNTAAQGPVREEFSPRLLSGVE
jgi:hypothetical protein